MAAQSTSFLLQSIFRLHGCYFSGWGGAVGDLLISGTSTFTIDNGDEARQGRDVRRNLDALLQVDKGGALLSTCVQKSTSALTKNKFRNFLLYQHIPSTSRIFCCHLLCIAPVQLQCKVISDWPLRTACGIGTCTAHACACLWVKRQNHGFSRKKKESCFPKVEHT